MYRETDGWTQKLMRRLDQGKYTRSLSGFLAVIDPLDQFERGEPTYHTPHGQLLRDCDVLHMPLTKKTRT